MISQTSIFDNPFTVTSPEGLDAKTIKRLFVDVFTDFSNIPNTGHTLVHGARGSGKSMMFRYLQPDCQALVKNKKYYELDFFAVYVSVKNSGLNLTELIRLQNKHADIVLNEHFMSTIVFLRTIDTLLELEDTDQREDVLKSSKLFLINELFPLLSLSGFVEFDKQVEFTTYRELLEYMRTISIKLTVNVHNYLKKLSFCSDPVPYHGPLMGYLDFIYPFFQGLKKYNIISSNPVFLLMDDVDDLSNSQTIVLNTWISTRTSTHVSIKASSRIKQYKTYCTVSSQSIDPIVTADVIFECLKECRKNKFKRYFIDITTFTHESLLILLKILFDFSKANESYQFGYTGAHEYSIGQDVPKKWLSKGCKDVRTVLGYSGIIDPSKKLHLIILVGFEHERATELVHKIEPDMISLGFGSKKGSVRKIHHQANIYYTDLVRKLLPVHGDVKRFDFSCESPESVKEGIINQINKIKDHNTVLAPMNNKISTLGAALCAFEKDELQICYAQADIYNYLNYSSPGRYVYVFKIDK